MDGVLVIDKPAGWTSHDVAAKLRKPTGTKRVGHSGTLDPDATGILLVGVGKATRFLRYLTELPKRYTFEIVLGVTTTTLDDSGDLVETYAMSCDLDEVRSAAKKFVGDIEQIPPMVSAVKIGGKKLHQLARQGIEVERKPRPVTVYSFEIQNQTGPNTYRAEVLCSSGTYVRTLADDVGRVLGGGAHLRNLRRTAIGSFSEADAVDLETAVKDPSAFMLSPAAALRDYAQIEVDDLDAQNFIHGRKVSAEKYGVDSEGSYVFLHQGQLVCVGHLEDDRIKTDVVIGQENRINADD